MFSHPQRVGHNSERRIHGAAGAEKAAIDDVEIIDIVRFAVNVERAGPWIIPEPNRPYLVRHACERDALPDVQVTSKQSLVAFMAMNLARGLLFH